MLGNEKTWKGNERKQKNLKGKSNENEKKRKQNARKMNGNERKLKGEWREMKGNENRMEKYFLRKAFDTPENPFLPDNVLWRQKEQFSDGVGYGWIDGIRDFCDKEITDNMLNRNPYSPGE